MLRGSLLVDAVEGGKGCNNGMLELGGLVAQQELTSDAPGKNSRKSLKLLTP